MQIFHHGATRGVTGSCHQLQAACGRSVLVDCGLFQGAETSSDGGAGAGRLDVGLALQGVQALVITHVHIDHVGRVPQLVAAGFDGPILCSQASAELLPLVLEDAMEIGFAAERHLVAPLLARLRQRLVPLHYGQWHTLWDDERGQLMLRLQPAGHILGSAFVELDLREAGSTPQRIVFSGDLGATDTPLLPDPALPRGGADVLVLESTYGNRLHDDRRQRRLRLQAVIERALANHGTVLIPAFSIGRTQELLYELEDIVHTQRQQPAAPGLAWGDLTVVVDSPLAADFTRGYARLKAYWDDEARAQLAAGRHPLDFSQLQTVGPHEQHLRVVNHLARSGEPAIVIAASGMCAGGRIVNYLKALLPDARHDVLLCGYQAVGTPGRRLQEQAGRAPDPSASVDLDGQTVPIRAHVHLLGGYSAHADQAGLLAWVAGLPRPPRQLRLVHGDATAKAMLAGLLRQRYPGTEVLIPR
ncbi:MBL fold metallo-hydrolase [Ideonella sp. 4Y16]|uniref:MBL fold metallo-hydrolase RNA specificity domain-containing protein n=1 Tax=Ideonella alba TaxID=2824118 RepID=UPI001B39AD7D|nr:MBL fold metallo-hydrolase [Ideonella alba]MBQ0943114.1 MBL fold metallo-hydrolase [Ideonella alba]